MIKNYNTILIDLNKIIKSSECKIVDTFIEFANKIKSKYDLVLVSDLQENLSELDLDEYFKHKIFGSLIGHKMMDLSFFDKALEIINKRPAECIFIDIESQNLLLAEEVGISPILFNVNNQHYYGMVVYDFNELYNLIG